MNPSDIEYIIIECDECGEKVKIKENAVLFTCPACGEKNMRPPVIQPFSILRLDFLKRISENESAGFDLVRWLSSKDQYTCKSCKEKDGKVFTLNEIRKILSERFCESDGFQQSCRCCLSPTNKFILSIEKK